MSAAMLKAREATTPDICYMLAARSTAAATPA